MDAFEQIIARIFEANNYWTLQSYRVKLSLEQKRAIYTPSTPNPEIDLLAYKPRENKLLWIECKSYLQSHGVKLSAVQTPPLQKSKSGPKAMRIFADASYRQIVTEQLVIQATQDGLLLSERPEIKFCLVAGNIYRPDREKLKEYFEQQEWILYDEQWIRQGLQGLAATGYENNVAIMMAKLMHQESKT